MSIDAPVAGAVSGGTPVRGWRAVFPPAIRAGVRGAGETLRLVLIDLSSSPMVDLAGSRMLSGLEEELRQASVHLRLVAARATVREILRAEGLDERVGGIDRRITVADVVDELERGSPARLTA